MSITRTALTLLLLLVYSGSVFAQPFTYQGFLKEGGLPANGTYDLTFKLFTELSGGLQVGSTITLNNQSIQNGVFTVSLDFGASVFGVAPRYLEIAVNGMTLSPRVAVTAVPYATFAFGPWGTDGASVFYSAGPVGIGTNFPRLGFPLTVRGIGANSDCLQFQTRVGFSRWHISLVGNGLNITETGVADYRLFLAPGGNVGIGTANPTARLEINQSGTNNLALRLFSTGPGWGSGMIFQNGGREYGIYAGSDGRWHFADATASTDRLTISSNGELHAERMLLNTGDANALRCYNNSPDQGGSYSTILVQNYGRGGIAGHFIGILQSTDKRFIIDHPLDPASKYLVHACVESDERRNIYDGVVILDANGEALVQLPEWFEALNRDFRYQLTCIGGYAPVYIADEIQNNRFRIAGGRPGLKVSWQVTGTRHDPYSQAHPFVPETEKPDAQRGKYLHPELYGQPREMGVGYQPEKGLQTTPPVKRR